MHINKLVLSELSNERKQTGMNYLFQKLLHDLKGAQYLGATGNGAQKYNCKWCRCDTFGNFILRLIELFAYYDRKYCYKQFGKYVALSMIKIIHVACI